MFYREKRVVITSDSFSQATVRGFRPVALGEGSDGPFSFGTKAPTCHSTLNERNGDVTPTDCAKLSFYAVPILTLDWRNAARVMVSSPAVRAVRVRPTIFLTTGSGWVHRVPVASRITHQSLSQKADSV